MAYDKAQLNGMTKEQLVELAAEIQLDTSGRKADLVKRIAAAEVEVQDEAELTEEDKAAIEEAAAGEDDEKDEAQETVPEPTADTEQQPQATKRVIEAGGSVKVTCIWAYHDNALNRVIEVGDQLKVSDERAQLLKSLKLVK